MTPADLRDALDRLGMTQADFARVTGYSERQIRRWLREGSIVPMWGAVAAERLLSERVKA